MRVFWGIVAVLIIAAAGALWLRGAQQPSSPVASEQAPAAAAPAPERRVESQTPAEETPIVVEEDGETAIAGAPMESPAPSAAVDEIAAEDTTGDVDEAATVVEADPIETEVAQGESAAIAIEESPVDDSPVEVAAAAEADAEGEIDEVALKRQEQSQAAAAALEEMLDGILGIESEDEARDEESAEAAEALAASAESEAPAADRITKRADGVTVIDDRFTVRGKGTKEDPYQVTWDLLVSANETYRPRDSKTDLPHWAPLINGSWVEIQGHLAFPLMADAIKEVLVMRNQWDGCCIGIPPTAYDAIEVKLAESTPVSRRGFAYGAIRGRLKVDPYLVNKWLIGLYVIEDGELDMGL
ncbi:MAG: hypothetical protein VYC34_05205 [Planctomycetota bacterium]|nr:hypothetical protein [Planctomycetota bacterium]